MKAAITFILLIIATVGFSQGDSLNQTDSKGRKQGKWVKNYEKGGVRYEGQFKNDKPIGVFKYYDEDGNMVMVMYHTGKNERTIANAYHPNGQMMAMGIYKSQKKDSLWQYYDIEGNKISEEFYEQGKLDGTVKTFYGSGTVAETKNYENGLLQGENKQYFEDGELKQITHFKNDKRNGEFIQYYPNGKKKLSGNYADNIRSGGWRYYKESGLLEVQEVYEEGEIVKRRIENGKDETYYKSGRLHTVTNYKNGKKEGEFIEYHNNGEEVKQPYKVGEMAETEDKIVIEGQTIKRKGNYVAGKLHGKMFHYNKVGKVIHVENYDNGKLVEGGSK